MQENILKLQKHLLRRICLTLCKCEILVILYTLLNFIIIDRRLNEEIFNIITRFISLGDSGSNAPNISLEPRIVFFLMSKIL